MILEDEMLLYQGSEASIGKIDLNECADGKDFEMPAILYDGDSVIETKSDVIWECLLKPAIQ